MVTLSSVRDWIESLGLKGVSNYYIGRINANEEKNIGIYQRNGERPLRIALGGMENTLYKEKEISILIHWNKNAKETDEIANSLYEKLLDTNLKIPLLDNHEVYFLKLETDEVVDVGSDNNGIFERVIWLSIVYNNKKIIKGE